MHPAQMRGRGRSDSGGENHEGGSSSNSGANSGEQRRTPDHMPQYDPRDMRPPWPDRMPPYAHMPGWEEHMRRHPFYGAFPGEFDRREYEQQYEKRYVLFGLLTDICWVKVSL